MVHLKAAAEALPRLFLIHPALDALVAVSLESLASCSLPAWATVASRHYARTALPVGVLVASKRLADLLSTVKVVRAPRHLTLHRACLTGVIADHSTRAGMQLDRREVALAVDAVLWLRLPLLHLAIMRAVHGGVAVCRRSAQVASAALALTVNMVNADSPECVIAITVTEDVVGTFAVTLAVVRNAFDRFSTMTTGVDAIGAAIVFPIP